MSDIQQMQEVTIAQAVEAFSYMDSSVPGMFWGEPGLGKTQAIQSTFSKAGYTVIPVLAGQSEPTDIQGIPFPDAKNIYSKYLIPWWAFYASDHPEVPEEFQGPMVLFFDDLVTAHEQTQAAFYKLIDEKHVGEHNIRDNVRICAAGNRVDDMSAVVDMPKALCNRFMHFYVRVSLPVWLEWAPKAGIHPHVIFYLRKGGVNISTFEDVRQSTEVHAWASPRTWEMLSKGLHKLDEAGIRGANYNGDTDYEFIVTQGSIGNLAIEFLAMIKNSFNVVDPEDILNDPKNVEVPEIQNVDRIYATVTNLEHYFASNPKNHSRYAAFLTYSFRLPDEFGLLLAKQFITVMTEKMDQDVRNKAIDSAEFDEMVDKWEDNLNMSFM